MKEPLSVAVVGERSSVLGFRALGLEVYAVGLAAEAEGIVRKLAQNGCGVIFLTETLAGQLPAALMQGQGALYPAVIPIMGRDGVRGFGSAALQNNIRRAVGTALM